MSLYFGGFLSNLFDSSIISVEKVAEKRTVCRVLGKLFIIRLISGKKPISSILSASSRTRYCKFEKFTFFRPRWSNLPGVATTISTPFFSLFVLWSVIDAAV